MAGPIIDGLGDIHKQVRFEARHYRGRITMKTPHSVRRLFVVHLVSNDKALVNSVGHVRNENER